MISDPVTGDDGVVRCGWAGTASDYNEYHDHEWGRPVVDDVRLFEKLCLEGFQSGLAWITILRKRENFRAAFDGFDFRVVANYDDDDVARLLDDAGIVRHQGKIRSTINNAKRAVALVEAEGSLARYVWSWEPSEREGDLDGQFTVPATTPTSTALAKDLKKRGWTFVGPSTVYAFMQEEGSSATRNGGWVPPSTTPESVAMAKDLKKRGWSFVGPTTCYAFMQSMGLVNDHVPGCHVRDEVDELRRELVRPS